MSLSLFKGGNRSRHGGSHDSSGLANLKRHLLPKLNPIYTASWQLVCECDSVEDDMLAFNGSSPRGDARPIQLPPPNRPDPPYTDTAKAGRHLCINASKKGAQTVAKPECLHSS